MPNNKMEKIVMNPDGLAEVIVVLAFLAISTVGFSLGSVPVSLSSLAAPILMSWALLMVQIRSWWSTAVMVLVVNVLLAGQVSMVPPLWLAAFLLIEVQWANAYWFSGSVTALASMCMATKFGESSYMDFCPEGPAQWLFPFTGIILACAVALLRKQFQVLFFRSEIESVSRLESERRYLAGEIHNKIANSLTRIVLFSEQESPPLRCIRDEAYRSVTELHYLLHNLKKSDTAVVQGGKCDRNLQELIDEFQFSCSSAGLNIRCDLAVNRYVKAPEVVNDALREIATNVIKHGVSPVLLSVDIKDEICFLKISNAIDESSGSFTTSSGEGLKWMTEAIKEIGGEFFYQEVDSKARMFLKFRVEEVLCAETEANILRDSH